MHRLSALIHLVHFPLSVNRHMKFQAKLQPHPHPGPRGVTSGNTKHEVRGGPLGGVKSYFCQSKFSIQIYIYTGPKWKEQGQHPHPSSWLNKKLSKIVDIRWDQVNCTSINITSVHIWGCIVHCGIHKSNWVV